MKITKYEHACIVLEEQGNRLVIDPGVFSISLPDDVDNVVAVVITHVHPDHFNPEVIEKIRANNPTVQIFSTEEVSDKLPQFEINIVSGGHEAETSPFKLKFFGGTHAEIHKSFPRNQNIGVLVNDRFYYPGDSLDLPSSQVKVLALPVNAPWMKIGEAIDFLAAIKPVTAIPTHNVLLSEAGEDIAERDLSGTAENIGSQIHRLNPGESIEV